MSQKINKDPWPPFAYDHKRASCLHVTTINATHFTSLTGLPTPSSPVKTSTYIEHGFPWYELYDEHIPMANNTSTPNPLNTVKSLGALLAQSAASENCPSEGVATDCVHCHYEFAVITLQPCGHNVGDRCSTVAKWPSCERVILARDRFATPMETMEAERDIGVEAGSLNQRIVKLRLNSGKHNVASFKESRHAISPLIGDGKD
jgi:hypothetical protein